MIIKEYGIPGVPAGVPGGPQGDELDSESARGPEAIGVPNVELPLTGGAHLGAFSHPGQQVVDPAIRMAIDDPGDDCGELGVRLDADQFAGLDKRNDDGRVLATAVGACKQVILSIQRDRPNGARAGVKSYAEVVREALRKSEQLAKIVGPQGKLYVEKPNGERTYIMQ